MHGYDRMMALRSDLIKDFVDGFDRALNIQCILRTLIHAHCLIYVVVASEICYLF